MVIKQNKCKQNEWNEEVYHDVLTEPLSSIVMFTLFCQD